MTDLPTLVPTTMVENPPAPQQTAFTSCKRYTRYYFALLVRCMTYPKRCSDKHRDDPVVVDKYDPKYKKWKKAAQNATPKKLVKAMAKSSPQVQSTVVSAYTSYRIADLASRATHNGILLPFTVTCWLLDDAQHQIFVRAFFFTSGFFDSTGAIPVNNRMYGANLNFDIDFAQEFYQTVRLPSLFDYIPIAVKIGLTTYLYFYYTYNVHKGCLRMCFKDLLCEVAAKIHDDYKPCFAYPAIACNSIFWKIVGCFSGMGNFFWRQVDKHIVQRILNKHAQSIAGKKGLRDCGEGCNDLFWSCLIVSIVAFAVALLIYFFSGGQAIDATLEYNDATDQAGRVSFNPQPLLNETLGQSVSALNRMITEGATEVNRLRNFNIPSQFGGNTINNQVIPTLSSINTDSQNAYDSFQSASNFDINAVGKFSVALALGIGGQIGYQLVESAAGRALFFSIGAAALACCCFKPTEWVANGLYFGAKHTMKAKNASSTSNNPQISSSAPKPKIARLP